MVYVFVCATGACLVKGGAKSIRCQLGKTNEFIPADAIDSDGHVDLETMKPSFWGVSTCKVCGGLTKSKCAACKVASYCGKTHQALDWKEGGHKVTCGTEAETLESVPNLLLPEFELIVDPEPSLSERQQADIEASNKLLEAYKANGQLDSSDTVDDISAKEVDDITGRKTIVLDPFYRYFNDRTNIEPDQCVRYSRWNDDAVLWVNKSHQIAAGDVPYCSYCGGKRKFEFQVLPQVLHYLKVEEGANSSLDFGIINVYTCSNSCSDDATVYKDEFVFVQNLLDD